MADLLYGASAIAQYMGLTDRQVRHLVEQHHLPVFKLGVTLCANRSSIDQWSREKEVMGRKDAKARSADF
jgi:excisionase family DNA binding protein